MVSGALEKLRVLKDRIDNANLDGSVRKIFVAEYNEYLGLLLKSGMNSPLPEDIEIATGLMLRDYLEFKMMYAENGPYTITNLFEDRDTVALVLVKKLKSRGRYVIVDPIEVFKGTLSRETKIIAPGSWTPVKWFRKREKCVVFLFNGSAGGSLGRMPIVCEEDQTFLECWDCDDLFWDGLETTCIHPGIIRVDWQMARSLFLELSER